MTGSSMAAAARELIGTPFCLQGRDPGTGLDCLGVVLAAIAGAGRSIPPLARQPLRSRDTGHVETLARQAGLVAATGDILVGDVLLVRCSPVQLHLLVAVSENTFVHAHAALRRVVQSTRDPAWPIVAHWRLPAID